MVDLGADVVVARLEVDQVVFGGLQGVCGVAVVPVEASRDGRVDLLGVEVDAEDERKFAAGKTFEN